MDNNTLKTAPPTVRQLLMKLGIGEKPISAIATLQDRIKSTVQTLSTALNTYEAWNKTPDGELLLLFNELMEDPNSLGVLKKIAKKLGVPREYWRYQHELDGPKIEHVLHQVFLRSTKQSREECQAEPSPGWVEAAWQSKNPRAALAHRPGTELKDLPPECRNLAGWNYLRRSLIRELIRRRNTYRRWSHKIEVLPCKIPLLSVERLAPMMQKAGISQGQLARVLGVKRPFISQILSRARPFPPRRQKQAFDYLRTLRPRPVT